MACSQRRSFFHLIPIIAGDRQRRTNRISLGSIIRCWAPSRTNHSQEAPWSRLACNRRRPPPRLVHPSGRQVPQEQRRKWFHDTPRLWPWAMLSPHMKAEVRDPVWEVGDDTLCDARSSLTTLRRSEIRHSNRRSWPQPQIEPSSTAASASWRPGLPHTVSEVHARAVMSRRVGRM